MAVAITLSPIIDALMKETDNKATAGGANPVFIARGWRRVSNFAGRQQLAEWAPLIRCRYWPKLSWTPFRATGQMKKHADQEKIEPLLFGG